MAKLLIWLLWFFITLMFTILATILGAIFLFPEHYTILTLAKAAGDYFFYGLLMFAAMTPVLWVTLQQKALFYPSILITLAIVIFITAGRQVTEETLLIGSIFPWTAVTIAGMVSSLSMHRYICLLSIAITAILGIAGSLWTFEHQDQ